MSDALRSSVSSYGLPLARVAAVFSLSCGVILDLATARYAGKGQGEVTLFRQLTRLFSTGDVVLADCLMCNWHNFFELNLRGVHLVTRLNKALRKADFRIGISLGKDDYLVRWPKPHIREVGRAAQRAMPRSDRPTAVGRCDLTHETRFR